MKYLKEEYYKWEKRRMDLQKKIDQEGWNSLTELEKEEYEIAPEMIERVLNEMLDVCSGKEEQGNLEDALSCYKKLCSEYNLQKACKEAEKLEKIIRKRRFHIDFSR